LYIGTMKIQEDKLENIAENNKNIVENYLAQQKGEKKINDIQTHELTQKDADQFFYYIEDSEKNLIIADEVNIQLRPQILQLLQKWNPKKVDTHQEKLNINYSELKTNRDRDNITLSKSQKSREVRLMIAGHPIFYQKQYIGMLYIGKDISFAYQLFHWLLVVLIILVVLFFGITLFISHLMSKRSMIPITNSFEKQRQFVADASHELRTPLSVMLSSLDAIEMTVDTEKNNFTQKLLYNMRNEVKRMTKLVSDLLTLARSDSDNLEKTFKTFDFRPLVEQVIDSTRILAKEKNVHIHLNAADPIIVQGDPEKLTQLLYILLDNGIKYNLPGGDIYLNVMIDLYQQRPTLFIKVRDTGIGIKQADHHLIFNRFYRLDKSRSRQTGGHGLGLAIAKLIVEAHHGTIEVLSGVKQGSTFIIKIPLSRKA
ncbi:ATP-binding protein, partial [Priestia megaterium]|uniref:sensor histidine kinase n=1 Tax=Priestia megaterium TaxID=1404 RepID=UPI002FFD5BF8